MTAPTCPGPDCNRPHPMTEVPDDAEFNPACDPEADARQYLKEVRAASDTAAADVGRAWHELRIAVAQRSDLAVAEARRAYDDAVRAAVVGDITAAWAPADDGQALGLLRRAIADPGQFLPRAGFGTPDAESVTSWSARAVLAALRGTVATGG